MNESAPELESQVVDNRPGDDIEQSLYAKRQKIYPREVHGLFAALRTLGVATLLGLYYIVPWLQWDGRQAVLFDLLPLACFLLPR
jgi:hypothetical protein